MNTVLALLFFVVLTLGCAALAARGRERVLLWRTVILAWLLLFPLLALVNAWQPLAGGGDDYDYFQLVATTSNLSLSAILDPRTLAGSMDQPGFPWLLSILHYFAGPDLLVFKMLNLTFFVLLAIVWYRIGSLLESPAFGRAACVAILCLTPLWYYVFFLLKDMTIILLQSLFLLGVVMAWRRSTVAAWLIIVGTTLAVLPFRTALLVQNAAVLVAAFWLKLFSRQQRGQRVGTFVSLFVSGLLAVGLLAVAMRPDVIGALGIAEDRAIGSEWMRELASIRQGAANLLLFPVAYLFTEAAALNPRVWGQLDASNLRGLLALPWIFVGVPSFLLGISRLFGAKGTNSHAHLEE
jgi:hypothetical protein